MVLPQPSAASWSSRPTRASSAAQTVAAHALATGAEAYWPYASARAISALRGVLSVEQEGGDGSSRCWRRGSALGAAFENRRLAPRRRAELAAPRGLMQHVCASRGTVARTMAHSTWSFLMRARAAASSSAGPACLKTGARSCFLEARGA